MDIEFSIWIASTTRWAHLTKVIPLPAVPRVGEFVKFLNATQGEYFAWRVTQVTYCEAGTIEVWTELLNDSDRRGFSFEDEVEFDEYMQSYLAEGWICDRGIRPNPYTTERTRRTQQGHVSDA